jgi:hypothetical protein
MPLQHFRLPNPSAHGWVGSVIRSFGPKAKIQTDHHLTTTGLDLPSFTEWGIAALLPPARLGVFEISAFFFSETNKPC